MAKCPSNTFLNSLKYCVKATKCPAAAPYGNPLTGLCVNDCPGDATTQLFADTNPNVMLCVYVCPAGYYIQNISSSPRICVPSCTANYNINYVTNTCVQNCSAGTFAISGTCLQSCPSPYYAQNSSTVSGICVQQCSGGKFRDSTTRTCVPQCPPGYFGDITGDVSDATGTYICKKTCFVST